MQGNGASRLSWHDSSIHLLFLDTRVVARNDSVLIDSIFLPRRKHKPEVHGPCNHSLHITLSDSIFSAKQRIDFFEFPGGAQKKQPCVSWTGRWQIGTWKGESLVISLEKWLHKTVGREISHFCWMRGFLWWECQLRPWLGDQTFHGRSSWQFLPMIGGSWTTWDSMSVPFQWPKLPHPSSFQAMNTWSRGCWRFDLGTVVLGMRIQWCDSIEVEGLCCNLFALKLNPYLRIGHSLACVQLGFSSWEVDEKKRSHQCLFHFMSGDQFGQAKCWVLWVVEFHQDHEQAFDHDLVLLCHRTDGRTRALHTAISQNV